jgi:hypothetical protein
MSNDANAINLDTNSIKSSIQRSTKIGSGNNLEDQSFTDSLIDNLLSNDKTMLSALEKLYKKYSNSMDEITNTSQSDLKRSFDQYIGTVENNFSRQVEQTECKKFKKKFLDFETQIAEIEKNHGGVSPDEQERQMVQEIAAQLKSNSEYNNSSGMWANFFIFDQLKLDFFHFYIVIIKLWLGEPIKQSEVKLIPPCKALVTRSLVKRKFNEEIDMRWAH